MRKYGQLRKSFVIAFVKRLLFPLLIIVVIFVSVFGIHVIIASFRNASFLAYTESYHRQFVSLLEKSQAKRPAPESSAQSVSTSPPISPTPKKMVTPIPSPVLDVPESQLWSALTTYRQEQRRSSLVLEEPLCVYARSRVKELEQRLTTLKSGDSPLDGHAGFQRDADDKTLFSRTGFPALAENLAYLPEYKTATQIIEWGWDSSAPHRDAQLGDEWTHACVVGTYPFYVAIFAHR